MAEAMRPTPEQAQAIVAFRTGESLVIEAGAGTGKTSTLVMLAGATGPRRRGQYVAFNRALVTDSAGKFPLSVACNTAHSLAFRALGRRFAHRLNGPRVPSWRLAQALEIEPLAVQDFEGNPRTLAAGYLATHVMRTIRSFCQSDATEISARHFPYIDGLDRPDSKGGRTYLLNNLIAERLLPAAKGAWEDLTTPQGTLPYQHDHYLKFWQLSDPRIDADYVLFDEAQDANPVIAAIVAAQASHAQLVYVGDSQQQIYEWTGAVNALARIEAANRTFLSRSFRFGQPIAEEANQVLTRLNAELRISGNPAVESEVGPVGQPRAILTRTNAAGLSRLIQLQQAGRRPHFLGGSADVLGFARAATELMATGHTTYSDLACFDSWAAVQEYVRADQEGADLGLMVRLVDKFGSEVIQDALNQMPPEAQADHVISTAHKAKGRQWPSVQLGEDFRTEGKDGGPVAPSELRLLYVALTRAQFLLDMTAVGQAEKPLDAPPSGEHNPS